MAIDSSYNYYNQIKWSCLVAGTVILASAIGVKILTFQNTLPHVALYTSLGADAGAIALFIAGAWASVKEGRIKGKNAFIQENGLNEKTLEAQKAKQLKLLEEEKAKAVAEAEAQKRKIEAEIEAHKKKKEEELNHLSKEISVLKAKKEWVHCETLPPLKGPLGISEDMCRNIESTMKQVFATADESGTIIIECQDGQVHAHDFILNHPYLKIHRGNILNLNFLTVTVTKKILSFLYTGKLEALTMEEACHIYNFASMACLDELKSHAKKTLLIFFHADPNTVILAYNFIASLNAEHLTKLDIELEELILSYFHILTATVNLPINIIKNFTDALSKRNTLLHTTIEAICFKEFDSAKKILKEAIAQNYAPALVYGALNKMGDKIELLKKACAQKYPPALRLMGNIHFNRKELGQAFKCYEEAAELGDIEALIELSDCYRFGTGVSTNAEKAFELAKRAAEYQYPKALVTLGILYECGGGSLVIDMKKAFHCYDVAAHNGFARAQYFLAQLYFEPEKYQNVVKQSKKDAIFWCTKAAENGSFDAKYFLQKLVT